jgi:uncharacterized membrane protein YeaQ/YmgE (transglycosylase-associated protein family)
MSIEYLITSLLVGALAGWLCGLLLKGSGFGAVGNIIVGVIGAFLGNFCFGLLGIYATSFLGHLIFAVVGAFIFIWLLRFIKK